VSCIGQAHNQLFEAEMRNATIEMDVREEVAQEMQATIQRMHDDFAQRLQEQVSLTLC